MATRTYGLSGSGMDVDQMVKDLMKARRASYDKVWQKKTQTEWKKKDYNTVYTLAEDFRNNTLFEFKKQNTLTPKQVTSTNDTVVSATANSEAANVSHSIIVNQLADGVKMSSSDKITDTSAGKSNESLVKQFGYDASKNPELNLAINGKTVKVKITDQTTIYDVVNSINNSGAEVKANYDRTLDRFYLYSNKTGEAAQIDFTGSDAAGLDFIFNKLKINTITGKGISSSASLGLADATGTLSSAFGITDAFSFDVTKSDGTKTTINIDPSTKTLANVLDQIKTAAGASSAIYDSASGKVIIKAGTSNFTLSSTSSTGQDFLTNKLKLAQYGQGQDAKVNIDGVDLAQSSNSFQVSGVSYNLKSVSALDPSDSTNTRRLATNINIQADIDKTVSLVKSFKDTYNTFLKAINTELNETKYRDFMPLTDAQKAEMKDSDIKAWNDKAQSGILRNDSILSEMVNNMRMDFATPIEGLTGKYKCAADIGIGTDSYIDDDGKLNDQFTNGGKIYVDEEKLEKALEEDPDAVYKIFGNIGDTTDTQGVANRLYNQMYSSMKRLKDEAGYPGVTDTSSSLALDLRDYDKRLYDMNDRLKQAEDRYYKQFDAMETALSRMNQQSAWLSQQLGGN